MADTIWRPSGDPPVPLKVHDNGDGTFALAVVPAGTRAAGDEIVRLTGDPPIPFLAKTNGDGTFSLATSSSGGGGGGMTVLQDVTLASPAGFVDLAVPAGTYKRFQIRAMCRSDQATGPNWGIQFNGDTGSNYRWTDWVVNSALASGAAGGNAASSAQGRAVTGTGAPAGAASALLVDILFPQSTVWHKVGLAACDYQDSNTNSSRSGFIWLPASPVAITTIRVLALVGNFVVNSRFQLLAD